MLCDYFVMAFLGLASNNPQRKENIGKQVTQVLREVSKYCHMLPQLDIVPLHLPSNKYKYGSDIQLLSGPPFGYSSINDMSRSFNYFPKQQNEVRGYNYGDVARKNTWDYFKNSIFPYRRTSINYQNQLPIFGQATDLQQMVYNDQVNEGLVRVPESALLKLVSPNQLSLLYQENQAMPINDPSAPRLIAISARLLLTLLRAKKNLHNAVDHGVTGAENIFSGLHETADAVAQIIGGGAHGLLDFIG